MKKKSKREVCWDWHIVDESENITLNMHKPIRKNVALDCNMPWEGKTCGYPSVLKTGDQYRLYYRASGLKGLYDESFCIAQSRDGKTFTRPELCQAEFNGSSKNNIFLREDRFIDNFSVHYDTNPLCPDDSKYKALSLVVSDDFRTTELAYYKSADGLHFQMVKILPIKGVFDTHNVVLWDDSAKLYRMYIRNFHDIDGKTSIFEPETAMEKSIRDIRLTTSKDFENWTEPERIKFDSGCDDLQLYTNQIIKYHRADIYIGMPTRYINRVDDMQNFKYLPDWNGERTNYINDGNRTGTALTDCVLMTSRDGFNFRRWDDAFLSPRLGAKWVYGDCYTSHGIIETASDDAEDVTELSFFTGEGYRTENTKFVRYTVRLDGFFSWRGNYSGGSLMTVPYVFSGETLNINFETSAFGSLRIQICDVDGKAIEGYDSGKLFGNTTSRNVDFEKPLSSLNGQTVRLKFYLSDCDLYSFIFEV